MALVGTMKYLTIGNNTYEIDGGDLPIASASTLGGIKVGSGLTIDSTTGVLNATGTSITIDNEMSDSSTNPVQNKVIKGYVDDSVSNNLFIAEYGVTSYSDIYTAYTNNKNIVCKKAYDFDEELFPLLVIVEDGALFVFSAITNYAQEFLVISSNNTWNTEVNLFASTSTATTADNGLMSSSDKVKLNGIATGAEVNIQSDWNESNSTSDAYINNKPTIPTKTSDITNDSGFLTSPNIPYLTCTTAAGTQQKVATLVSGTLPSTLNTGLQVIVKFTNTNSASMPTLKVGDYSAISIRRYGTTSPSDIAKESWQAGSCISFVYDGTNWQMCDWTNTNTTYSALSQSEMQTGTATTGRLITAARLKEAVEYHAPVTSVNGATGEVTISVPTKTSDLTNDSGFITSYTETDPVFSASAAAGITNTDISNWNGKTSNTGTVTSVGLSNATNGGLSISGSPITSSGSITVGHSNILASAQTTSGIYPIKIDKNGHISEYGSAVSIPTITLNGSSTTSPSFYAPTSGGTSGYVLQSNGNNAPSWVTAVLTDQRLYTSATSANTTYYGIFDDSSATGTSTKFYDTKVQYSYIAGTSESVGKAIISLGNDNNLLPYSIKGQIKLYAQSGSVTIDPGTSQNGAVITLPNTTGTAALTSDVPTKTSDLTNDSGFITVNNVPTEVFIATYGTTTSAEIEAAYQANKEILIFYNVYGTIAAYRFSRRDSSTKHQFINGIGVTMTCDNDTWSTTSVTYVPTSRTINSKALSSNITLSASDVGATLVQIVRW